jgi:GntR family galactonate operon transcriptional repressor
MTVAGRSAVGAKRGTRKPRRVTKTTKPTPSLVDHALLTIGRWIIDGRYAPGDTLPTEQEICAQLGVGRNAMREAIKMLVSKGFLRTVRRTGITVEPRAKWSMLDPAVLSWALDNKEIRAGLIKDLTGLRYIIEPEVAALAASNATSTDILRIYEAFEQMERHGDDVNLAIEADIAFHARLFEGAHNQLLSSIVPAFALLLRANLEIALQSGNFISGLDQHKQVLDAIHRRDADDARVSMRRLLDSNTKDLADMRAGTQIKEKVTKQAVHKRRIS